MIEAILTRRVRHLAAIAGFAGLASCTAAPAPQGLVEHYPASGTIPKTIAESVRVPAQAEWLVLSGITPKVAGDTETQTADVLSGVQTILARRGYRMSDVVRLTVYLVGDPATGGHMDYMGMNCAYQRFFGPPNSSGYPTRATVQVVSLAKPDFLVEIEVTAARTTGR